MTADIATLGIKVDSSGVRSATDDLNKLNNTGKDTAEKFGILTRASAELAGKLAGIGIAGAVTGFIALVRNTANAADALRDLSKTTSLTVEQLSGLKLASAQTGTSLEGISQTVGKLNATIGANSEKFKQLGIDSQDPIENLARISDIFVSIEDPQKRAAFAAEALGKSWQETAPLLSEGGDSIREMVTRGQELSGITSANADDADKLNDALADLSAEFQGMLQRAIVPAIPLFSQLLEYFTPMRTELDGIKDSAESLNPVFSGLMQLVAGLGSAVVITGKSIGAAAAQFEALTRLDFNAITAIQIANDKDITNEIAKFTDFSVRSGQPAQAEFVKPKNKGNGVSSGALTNFLGAGGGDKEKSGGRSGKSVDDTARSEIEQLDKKIALYGDATRAAEILYDTESGALKGIDEQLKQTLITRAESLDALEAATKAERENERAIAEQTKAMEQAKREADRLYQSQRKQVDDIAKFLKKQSNTELDNLREFYDEKKKIILENTAVTEIERQQLLGSLQQQSVDAETEYYKAGAREQIKNAASTFNELAMLTRNNINQNNVLYKAAFAASKAFAIADATITTYEMANKAYLRGLEIPYVGAVLGPVFAGVALAAGLARVANIASQSPGGGAFHGGTDYVPKEQSYLLDRGERVLSPRQNQDLTSYLQDRKASGGNRSVVINMNVNMSGNSDERTIRMSASQIAQRTGMMVNKALARNS
ncbi:MAG: hypothetical protein K2Q45_03060 [Nitrosomonas sp.]|nr:hypothetical protein [Nitrosomonas sp.]